MVCNYRYCEFIRIINTTIVWIVKLSTSTYFKGVIFTTLGDTVVVGILLHLAQVHLVWENTSFQTTFFYWNIAHFWRGICDPWWNRKEDI